MRLSSKPLLAFTLLALLAPAAKGFEPARIQRGQDVQTPDEIGLDVSGIWPDTCAPRLESISAQGHDITLHASRETEGCRETPTPYAFASDPVPRQSLAPQDGTYRVRLILDGSLTQDPVLAGFALLRLGDPAPALESGFWWTEQGGGEFGGDAGLGLSVETQSNMLSLSVMGYDARGNSTWYFGAGETVEGSARLELGRFQGGAGPFEAPAAPTSIDLGGWVDVEAQTPSRAILWFSRADSATGQLQLRPVSIVRFSFEHHAGNALLGRWLIASEESEARATRWVEWTHVEEVPDGYLLSDASGRISLHCLQEAGRDNAPPAFCRLDWGQGDVIELTDIALRRMGGWDAQTRRVVAFRID